MRLIEDVLTTGELVVAGSIVAGQTFTAPNRQLVYKCHPNFRLFLTQNPASTAAYSKSRKNHGTSLLSHMSPIEFPPVSPSDMHIIINAMAGTFATAIGALFDLATSEDVASVAGASAITLRDIIQACHLARNTSPDVDVPTSIFRLFAQGLPDDSPQYATVRTAVEASFGEVTAATHDGTRCVPGAYRVLCGAVAGACCVP